MENKKRIPWNKGMKPEEMFKHYKKGKLSYSFEKGNQFSKNRIGIKQSEEHIIKRVEARKGFKHSEETKLKISRLNKGKRLGIVLSKETKDKISFGVKKEKNGNWKGDEAGRWSFHQWINTNYPKPEFCEECKKVQPYDLANIKNHNYTRNVEDYKWLCRSCHKKLDFKNKRLEKEIAQ